MPNNELHCAICGQRSSGVFCGLAEEHVELLDHEKVVYTYDRGQALFYEGHSATTIYSIYAGRIRLFKIGRKDEETTIRLLGPGDVVGYRAMLAGEPYAATAEAIETATVCAISRDTLFKLLKQSPELAMEMLARLSRELRTSEDQMIALLQESVRQRTARLLLWLADQGNAGERGAIDLPLQRKELAQMVGTTPETLSRTLRHFSDRGLIEVSRDKILIRNAVPLKRLAHSENDS